MGDVGICRDDLKGCPDGYWLGANQQIRRRTAYFPASRIKRTQNHREAFGAANKKTTNPHPDLDACLRRREAHLDGPRTEFLSVTLFDGLGARMGEV
jgi:hypothetical protein